MLTKRQESLDDVPYSDRLLSDHFLSNLRDVTLCRLLRNSLHQTPTTTKRIKFSEERDLALLREAMDVQHLMFVSRNRGLNTTLNAQGARLRAPLSRSGVVLPERGPVGKFPAQRSSLANGEIPKSKSLETQSRPKRPEAGSTTWTEHSGDATVQGKESSPHRPTLKTAELWKPRTGDQRLVRPPGQGTREPVDKFPAQRSSLANGEIPKSKSLETQSRPEGPAAGSNTWTEHSGDATIQGKENSPHRPTLKLNGRNLETQDRPE
ncbi:hypothetical protein EGW08_018794 [Elysia chlorotica]|uniref:Uncharacterized protein n=1 Tax=Elysia chlorotica TaxID=188477 RepID=A0A3S0Z8Y4_ELYCH|nr:hypothetical protein EGW08_018794 [Elysia chlorotica]